MKQAVMTAAKTITFRDVPVPEYAEDEVLLKVKRIGVCGSDIHVYHGLHPYAPFPVVQGHEVSAVVEKTGAAVTDLGPGDKVTIEPQVSCGKCFSCRQGLYNICDELKVIGFQTIGTASEFFVAPRSRLIKLPANMDVDHGAMIEPLAVGVRAVKQVGDIRGQQVLVLGAGPIGNLVAQAAKGAGAAAVMSADLNPFRLEIASRCGVDHVVNVAEESLADAVVAAYGADRRADVIFECVGSGAVMNSAIEIARKGTPIVVVGVFGKPEPVDMAAVNEKELKLLGTARYVIEDFETAISLVEKGAVTLAPLVTDTFGFGDYNKAYVKIDEEPDTSMKILIAVDK